VLALTNTKSSELKTKRMEGAKVLSVTMAIARDCRIFEIAGVTGNACGLQQLGSEARDVAAFARGQGDVTETALAAECRGQHA